MGAHQATAASAGFSQPRTSVTIPGELPESQVYLAKSVKSGHGFDLNLYVNNRGTPQQIQLERVVSDFHRGCEH
ncbi:hypothetical protein PSHT_06070 [Puccinia striiformis]|uniref:Uncharacterized protein n=1 Tax=Puccinia striiformis TaxID=27350 RepID=A0A2S4W931_9BASI|nr:hypothetical protein PSHT_06070 [Puccinia striiformis]